LQCFKRIGEAFNQRDRVNTKAEATTKLLVAEYQFRWPKTTTERSVDG